jgi:hypothetical protein
MNTTALLFALTGKIAGAPQYTAMHDLDWCARRAAVTGA